jgi:hypothetical protein
MSIARFFILLIWLVALPFLAIRKNKRLLLVALTAILLLPPLLLFVELYLYEFVLFYILGIVAFCWLGTKAETFSSLRFRFLYVVFFLLFLAPVLLVFFLSLTGIFDQLSD